MLINPLLKKTNNIRTVFLKTLDQSIQHKSNHWLLTALCISILVEALAVMQGFSYIQVTFGWMSILFLAAAALQFLIFISCKSKLCFLLFACSFATGVMMWLCIDPAMCRKIDFLIWGFGPTLESLYFMVELLCVSCLIYGRKRHG